MSVLLISSDLMAGSWAAGAAAQASIKVDTAMSAAEARRLAAERDYRLAIVDLSSVGPELAALVSDLQRGDSPPQIIAFGPHVQDQLLAAARSAGCDRVLTRGQFHSQVGQLIAAAGTTP